MTHTQDEVKKISQLAGQAMQLAMDDILIHLRFMGNAAAALDLKERFGLEGLATDAGSLYYDPVYVLRLYQNDPKALTRGCLHSLFHCVFSHPFGYDRLDQESWDLAADIAVEAVIHELAMDAFNPDGDQDITGKLKVLKQDAGSLTADKLYKYFKKCDLPLITIRDYKKTFRRDDHVFWKTPEKLEITEEQWKKITQRIRTQLKSFTKARNMGDALKESLDESTRQKYDYTKILQRFMVMGEEMHINEDEYDYIFYTYGLSLYEDLPLIEPLEYRDEKRIKEFVIALDTSASCSGNVIKGFLRKTYDILKSSESFFEKVNIHIIQCDSQIQSDERVTNAKELEDYLKKVTVRGFGGTDFRPVFEYVEGLREQGEFESLKGLIYFTDGFGIYPASKPDFDVIFAFLSDDDTRGPVPTWSMKAVLSEDELEYGKDDQ